MNSPKATVVGISCQAESSTGEDDMWGRGHPCVDDAEPCGFSPAIYPKATAAPGWSSNDADAGGMSQPWRSRIPRRVGVDRKYVLY